MALKKVSTKKRGRGRPQLYPLTPAQEQRIVRLIGEGFTTNQIAEKMGIHEFAVLRVRRAL